MANNWLVVPIQTVKSGGACHADVFWVFGSPKVIGENVMLTVATSNILSGPTRLLFPRGAGSVGEAAAFPFSLLGVAPVHHPPVSELL